MAAGIGVSTAGFSRHSLGASIEGSVENSSMVTSELAKKGIIAHHEIHTDVVIVGGGMSGVCAAIAAARNGSNVVLIQDRSVLGGNASSEVRMHIVGADHHGNRSDTDSRESGILEELRLETAVRNPQRSACLFDLQLLEWIRNEEKVTLLLNTHCYGVKMKSNNQIAAVCASRHSTEDDFLIYAPLFIDCSGDGRLGAEAGAEFRVGREGRGEYGESMAPPQADRITLGSSILIMARKYDRPVPFIAPYWAHKFDGPLPHRGIGSYEYGFWWNEWGGELDTIKDNEAIRDELLSTALGIWDLIKNSGHYKDSENWALEWIGPIPGKRESRRFVGDYVLKEQDCKNGEVFEDGAAFGGWPLDLHHPKGIHTDEPPFISVKTPMYNIPLRCLYSKNISNLLFAGRNISASHVAFGSTRVMGTCSVMGQAAGTAAALCVKHKCTPRALGKDSIKELQQRLLKDDAYIIGAVNDDPDDHARRAYVHASSDMPGWYRADSVINGVARGVSKRKNGWVSNPENVFPHWIELNFAEEKRIREIYVTFDTGLNRQLTLTHSDGNHRHQIWGPQPETVRDYEIQVLHGESAETVARVEGNYQRRRIHTFDARSATGIRLIVHSTNGSKEARIFEIRAYS
ncbi:MAG: FAD-dependent oxidoreductase [Candidatus Omnitrophica bacterium]|nr:FAD-dependent oxidoreductase [Candidatus Omnitrophota bacterium]